MSADDVELHTLPLYHCAQLDCFLGTDVYLGATSIILPAPDPAAILRTIEAERVTKFFCPPTVWIALLRCPDFDTTRPLDAAQGLLRRLADAGRGAEGDPAPAARRRPVELLRPDRDGAAGHDPRARRAARRTPGSAGRAALNVETRIVDDADQPVPPATVGEIVHRSPHATLGYYHDEAKTAEAFRDGWFHSGDLGYVDEDGRLYVVDRKKDMIKTGGENVASREVEEALYELDGVAEVAVFGISHPRWVEAVAAVVVPKEGVALTSEARLEHAARACWRTTRRPKYVVIADALPKNPSGKILKRELREAHADLAAVAERRRGATGTAEGRSRVV